MPSIYGCWNSCNDSVDSAATAAQRCRTSPLRDLYIWRQQYVKGFSSSYCLARIAVLELTQFIGCVGCNVHTFVYFNPKQIFPTLANGSLSPCLSSLSRCTVTPASCKARTKRLHTHSMQPVLHGIIMHVFQEEACGMLSHSPARDGTSQPLLLEWARSTSTWASEDEVPP